MKFKCEFETVDMGEEIILVPVGDRASEIHGVLKLNESGKEIVDFLQEDTSLDMIIDSLLTKYKNDRNEITAYVCKTIKKLKAADLILE